MIPLSAPFPSGFGGPNTAQPTTPNAVPGQAAAAFPGVTPVSQEQNQTRTAVPAAGNPGDPDTNAQDNNTDTPTRGQYGKSQSEQLTEEEQQQVEQLKSRDRAVRAHEAAHAAAAGKYVTRGAHFQYKTGPDGRRYAVGGEVNIDTSPIPGDPDATIQKAETLRAAALAPADPSGQDRQVALAAARMAARARIEKLAMEQAEKEVPSDYKPPAIRAYQNMSGYFDRITQVTQHQTVSYHA
ncbi:MAG: hypothetical protein HUJ30_08815 [Gammaproteobacteria bacterium]|nr:hypothetical protein [Gammaproteobacteria bacterium]